MISRKSVSGIAATAIVLIMTAGCGSNGGSDSTTSPGESTRGMRSGIATTASSVVSSVLNTAQQKVQDGINAALAAVPITFDSGSSDLSAVDVATIKAVAVPLKGNDTKVKITTYAQDSNVAAAKSLAKARGDNIASQLESEGIDKARITVQAEANPTAADVQVDAAQIAVVPE
ncbi:OmpA family protein [Nocardia gipuzkoensis]|uniref:OmpA family protein n=1 Tax=Nocardia gipuzkoensis TaxID=2749991 RepID=UPI001E40F9C7|nr:OmpA family protein [Nocardia gipuzkoensis]UGT67664.1 OmpA family protein [Nocardia gipuzkoensis]